MSEDKAGGAADVKLLLREFAALRVSPGAVEESLHIKLADAGEADCSLMRRVIGHMRNDRLTLSKAIAVARRPDGAAGISFPAKSAIGKSPSGIGGGRREQKNSPAARPEKREPPRRLTGKVKLLIVESPAKAKTIKKFLGNEFVVKASMGHVRDMPVRVSGADIGIDFAHGYQPVYVPIASREKVIRELRTALNKAGHVYLAPDPDREGEAIAWHLKELLNLPDDQTSRVTFNAITRSAVREAMARPAAVNMDLVNAQQGRRVLDRIVGYRLSPFLWKKVAKGLSAGRVQSVAMRLVAEREEEIRAFISVEFWRIRARMRPEGGGGKESEFQAELVSWKGGEFVLPGADKKISRTPTAPNEAAADAIAAELRGKAGQVAELTEREVKGRPSPPFITSTLQQAASTLLGFGTQRTMRVAQQLYEGVELEGGESTGLITYMRTDSTRIAPEAIAEVRDYIGKNLAPPYLPAKPNFYASRQSAQDAHEAIRPASTTLTPEKMKPFLSSEQYRLYDLIWRRFVASQLAPAEYLVTTAKIAVGEGVFEAKGRTVVFDGHTVVSSAFAKKRKVERTGKNENDADVQKDGADEKREEDQILPALAKGQMLAVGEIVPGRHQTQPPPRFSEASLVRELEKEGIGRPSTYAPIVQTIQDRGYVRQENRRFFATRLGMAVTGILKDNFPDIMNVKFTARMESDLDSVEEGKADWSGLVDRFYKPFESRLGQAMASSPALKGQPAPNGEKCPECGADMMIRYNQRGAFLGCSRYPECSGSRRLAGEEGTGEPNEADLSGVVCPVCGGSMVVRRSRFGLFLACSAYPNCKGTRPIAKDGKVIRLPEVNRVCEKCGKPMQVKSGRRGPFLSCTGYPDCRNAKHIDKDGKVVDLPEVEGEVCEKCGAPMTVRMSRRGPFLSCTGYPKCRNARPLPKPRETGTA
ncbi:MAG: type I DNA topoisomerase [Planctomycetota bacterium]|nr:type I DNA topoisomerase [Planctomycetota bacterium]